MSQPKVSFHLNVLKEAGLIKDRKDGRWIYYRLDESDVFKRFLVLSVIEKSCGKDVADDGKRLKVFASGKKDNYCMNPKDKNKSNRICGPKELRKN